VDILEQVLTEIAGGRVLDVATGRGRFAGTLRQGLGSYRGIVGIDSSVRALAEAQRDQAHEDVSFVQMDAGRIGFRAASVDTVCLSAALHHLADIPAVLAEVLRVLRPGGHLVIAEMHHNARTEAQRTAIDIHHWAAGVDRAVGYDHYPTLARQEIVDLVTGYGLRQVMCHDWADTTSDPGNKEAIAGLEGVIDRYVERAGEAEGGQALQKRGEALRRRLHEVGIQREPVLVVVGIK
jgi:SAM-dependent methyltransferase